MKHNSRSLFDEEYRLEKISKQRDPLEILKRHVDFELFRKPLDKHFRPQEKDLLKGGRPWFDYVLMFKILILQRYYNISDDATEYAILDRLSFMRFLGLRLSDRVPDAKTIWNFRNNIANGGLVEELFTKLDSELNKRGVIAHDGKMADASFVEVPRQRNTREENMQLKKGEIPEEWKDKPNKLRQKDIDASWTQHNGQNYFGYKDHVKADTETKLITAYEVTPANVHDSNVLEQLLDKKDRHQYFYADSAYRSKKIENKLKKKKIKSKIHEKGYRGNPLTEKQKKRNRKKSKVRARVEHIFGFMENSMNGMYIRCRDFTRASATIGLMNITYNLFRITQLKISIARA